VSNTNRTKGHNYERLWVKRYKEVGFPYCKTSRMASKLLDDSKVDLAFIPYNHQCKKVIANINYFTLMKDIKEALHKNYPPNDKQLEHPIIISHDKGKGEELVIMHCPTYLNLLKEINELKQKENAKNEQCKSI
jgi:hypothetical protein